MQRGQDLPDVVRISPGVSADPESALADVWPHAYGEIVNTPRCAQNMNRGARALAGGPAPILMFILSSSCEDAEPSDVDANIDARGIDCDEACCSIAKDTLTLAMRHDVCSEDSPPLCRGRHGASGRALK